MRHWAKGVHTVRRWSRGDRPAAEEPGYALLVGERGRRNDWYCRRYRSV